MNAFDYIREALRQLIIPGQFSFMRLVLDHGRNGHQQALPEWMPAGVMRQCFDNSSKAALMAGEFGHHDMYYTEGFALHGDVDFPVSHAWIMTGDGKVYDPTWDFHPDTAYVGLRLDPEFARKAFAKERLGAILEGPDVLRPLRRDPELLKTMVCIGPE